MRSTGSAELERALELAELAPLSLAEPDPALRADPSRDAFWHASALAWNAGVREARRRFLGARAFVDSAGAPQPITVQADSIAGEGERESELKATLDVLGLFGLGPARAAKALASQEARLAFAQYESRVFNAWIDVDRARVELGAKRRLLAALDALAAEQEPLARRREILANAGFVPPGSTDLARTAETMLATERSNLRADVTLAREALALAAGLPIDAQALDADTEGMLDALNEQEPVAAPAAAELWDARPEVRAMRVRCALAEAKLDLVLADRFPDLRVGVKSMFTPETVLAGPMLEAALAWPGARDGRIEAAHQECEEMREAVEAELLAALARARTAADVWSELRRLHHADLELLDRESRAGWTAARARFLNDPEALEDAARMLGERAKALRMVHEHDGALALAALEFRRAAGAAPRAHAAPRASGASDSALESRVQP
ncbi:MAG: hypothetical protein HZA52_01280 [Planctomycetes bacterium]|nr:hypothetical protein [Planctomycetota bacterium]